MANLFQSKLKAKAQEKQDKKAAKEEARNAPISQHRTAGVRQAQGQGQTQAPAQVPAANLPASQLLDPASLPPLPTPPSGPQPAVTTTTATPAYPPATTTTAPATAPPRPATAPPRPATAPPASPPTVTTTTTSATSSPAPAPTSTAPPAFGLFSESERESWDEDLQAVYDERLAQQGLDKPPRQLFDALDGHARGEIFNKAASGDGGFAAWVKRQRAGAGKGEKAKEKLYAQKSIPVSGDPPDFIAGGSIDPVLQDEEWIYAFRQWAEENLCLREVMFLQAIDSFRKTSDWDNAQYIVNRYFFKDPDMFDNWTDITARINKRVQDAIKRIQGTEKTDQ